MPMLPINGTQLRVRLVEIELDRLKLDPDNPRLHSAYLTHALPSRPNEKQIIQALEGLPEFQALLDAISRNHGCFQPPLITVDHRVLEGNRRVTALRKLRAEDPQSRHWETVTVHQLTARVAPEQERALRSKFHLEHALAWDGLSQLTEYVAMAERDGMDALATLLGKFRSAVEPVVVAGQAVRLFSQTYSESRSQELLWVLVGMCGVREIVPKVMISTAARCIYTARDEERPREQPFTLAQVMKWLAEERFTKPYEEDGRASLKIRLRGFGNAMTLFKNPCFCRRGRFDYQIGNSSRGRNAAIDLTARFQWRRIVAYSPINLLAVISPLESC
jgi:hypothetical protein